MAEGNLLDDGQDKEIPKKEDSGTDKKWFEADGIDEEYRKDPNINSKASINDLLKDHVNAQKLIGKKGMPRPDDNAPQEEWDKFYEYSGKPKVATEYGIDDPDSPFAAEGFKKFLDSAHAAGLNKRQAKQVYDSMAGMLKTNETQRIEAIKASKDKAFNQLSVDLGGDEQAKEYLGKVVGFLKTQVEAKHPGFMDIFAKATIPGTNELLVNHPMIARVFGMLSEPYEDDKRQLNGVLLKGPEDLQKELEAINIEIYNTSDYDDVALQKLQDKRKRIEAALYKKT